jgi:hypothetical protein
LEAGTDASSGQPRHDRVGEGIQKIGIEMDRIAGGHGGQPQFGLASSSIASAAGSRS